MKNENGYTWIELLIVMMIASAAATIYVAIYHPH